MQRWNTEDGGGFRHREVRTDSRDWGVFWQRWADSCERLDAAGRRGSAAGVAEADSEVKVYAGAGWKPDGWMEKN